jgi:hypothetical protein
MGHHFEFYLEPQISSGHRKRPVYWLHAVVLKAQTLLFGYRP